MGKKASFPMRKLFKVAAKAKCVAKAKTKSKPLKKGLKKAPSKTLKGVAKPTKKNVKKLGKETSLVEKVQALAKGAQTAEEAVDQVQQGLDKLDKSKLWSQHQSHLKKDPEAQEEQAKLGKKEKGAQATLWFLRKKVPQFASFSEQRQESTTLKKVDKRMSEKEALTKWSDQELEAHCQSGRALAKAKGSSYCSAASLKDGKKLQVELEACLQKVKGVLQGKRPCKKEAVQLLLQEAAAKVNEAKDTVKELLAVAAKTSSRCGSKSSRLK
ncbi:unnamed protein product, partial [Symbiodinium microadriaticum]